MLQQTAIPLKDRLHYSLGRDHPLSRPPSNHHHIVCFLSHHERPNSNYLVFDISEENMTLNNEYWYCSDLRYPTPSSFFFDGFNLCVFQLRCLGWSKPIKLAHPLAEWEGQRVAFQAPKAPASTYDKQVLTFDYQPYCRGSLHVQRHQDHADLLDIDKVHVDYSNPEEPYHYYWGWLAVQQSLRKLQTDGYHHIRTEWPYSSPQLSDPLYATFWHRESGGVQEKDHECCFVSL
jgi:hypothetical protein